MIKILLITAILGLLGACASPYPLGMSEKQWQSITPDERKALLLKQQQYNAEQKAIQLRAKAKARELQLQKDIAERKRLDYLYNHPQQGNVMMVNILDGTYQSGKNVKQIMEATYEVARGETKKIQLQLKSSNTFRPYTETAYLQYSDNGNAIYLYLNHPKYRSNERISLLRDGHWLCGSHYQKHLQGSYKSLQKISFFVKETGSRCGLKRRYY